MLNCRAALRCAQVVPVTNTVDMRAFDPDRLFFRAHTAIDQDNGFRDRLEGFWKERPLLRQTIHRANLPTDLSRPRRERIDAFRTQFPTKV